METHPVGVFRCPVLLHDAVQLRIVKVEVELRQDVLDESLLRRKPGPHVVTSAGVGDVHGEQGGHHRGDLSSHLW